MSNLLIYIRYKVSLYIKTKFEKTVDINRIRIITLYVIRSICVRVNSKILVKFSYRQQQRK